MKTPEPKKDRKTTTAIFANSKGGVGKSTLALLTCLGLASRYKSASVELIDLDSQSTSSASLQRFSNHRFSVINDDHLFLASGSPNNGNIVNQFNFCADFRQRRRRSRNEKISSVFKGSFR